DRTKFRNQILNPLLENQYVEMTIPDKPKSSKQKYRITENGKEILIEIASKNNFHDSDINGLGANGSTMSALSRHQVEVLRICNEEQAIGVLMSVSGRTDRTKFRNQILNPLLENQYVEMTIPDKPKSSKQKYRLTNKGKQVLQSINPENDSHKVPNK
ncbi:MAG: hypothetical protein KAI81_10190, partial [Candidatus Marinimicrobia bacterium]|nr:hypothetical protein [Candidatus Neomarinimicrobiota bacterium]